MKSVPYPSRAILLESAGDLLRKAMAEPASTPHAVLLAGGQTPLPAYRAMAYRRFRVCPNSRIILTDERMVPYTSPGSNYRNISRELAPLRLPKSHILKVDTHLPLHRAADAFNSELSEFLTSGGTIRLALMGLGADGHTASLFTLEDATPKTGRYAIPIRRGDPPDRVSVTSDFIRHAARVIFIASGPAKREVVETLIRNPRSLPAGLAVRGVEAVEVWYSENDEP